MKGSWQLDERCRGLSAEARLPCPPPRNMHSYEEPCLPADMPLVSCIMPTNGRHMFVPRAIEYFLRQDYPSRELVILDDGGQPVEYLLPGDSRIRYIRASDRGTIGGRRNQCIENSHGDLIAHWDD